MRELNHNRNDTDIGNAQKKISKIICADTGKWEAMLVLDAIGSNRCVPVCINCKQWKEA